MRCAKPDLLSSKPMLKRKRQRWWSGVPNRRQLPRESWMTSLHMKVGRIYIVCLEFFSVSSRSQNTYCSILVTRQSATPCRPPFRPTVSYAASFAKKTTSWIKKCGTKCEMTPMWLAIAYLSSTTFSESKCTIACCCLWVVSVTSGSILLISFTLTVC